MAPTAPLLAPEDLASQLSTIEVLLSIYNGTTELVPSSGNGDGGGEGEGEGEGGDLIISADTYAAIRNLAEFLNLPLESLGGEKSVHLRDSLPTVIQIGIKMDPLRGTLDETPAAAAIGGQRKQREHLVLVMGFAMRRVQGKGDSKDDALRPRCNLKQADWMNRSVHDSLSQSVKDIKWETDESVDYIMNVVETISEASIEYIQAYKSGKGNDQVQFQAAENNNGTCAQPASEGSIATSPSPMTTKTTTTTILRTWHLFPSLSMKDKRRDLVKYANEDYHFTGFVLAGKPGLVVLESPQEIVSSKSESSSSSLLTEASRQMDDFWSDIKTNSWSDLPASHKKVSERYREENVTRSFGVDVKDITAIEELGGTDALDQSGRIRTPDLDKLRVWLKERGCTGQLDVVLGKDV